MKPQLLKAFFPRFYKPHMISFSLSGDLNKLWSQILLFLLLIRKQLAAQTFCLPRQFEMFLLSFMFLKHIREGVSEGDLQ